MMRMYRKTAETDEKVTYEYLCSDHTRPYTGLVEIRKSDLETTVLRPAEGEKSARWAGFNAMYTFPKLGYPKTYTHTGT